MGWMGVDGLIDEREFVRLGGLRDWFVLGCMWMFCYVMLFFT